MVILPDAEVKDISRFAQALEAHGITSTFLSPVLLRSVLQLPEPFLSRLSKIRVVTVTGAALTPDLAESFFQTFPHAQLVNVYGSTEIGTTATISVMNKESISRQISIGSPVANTRIYLLDDNLEPVPIETPGEIFVGAPHLARGYLNRPELTSERFIQNPWRPGERLYRTGDLGRQLPNGEIRLLGRRDHQVKVRGFRIELGEIEAVLEVHDGVQEAVVKAQEHEGDNRLIAYVIARPTARFSANALRSFLHERLPEHMVPSRFLRLSAIPRTSFGKVDRNALPEHDPSRPELETPYESPRDHAEALVAQIWSDVLGVGQVGIHDSFLELGGDSLAAAQIILRIRDRFGLNLSLEELLDRTIADVAPLCNR